MTALEVPTSGAANEAAMTTGMLSVEPLRRSHAQRFQFAVQGGAFHADEGGGAGDVAAEAVDLRHQIIALENLPRFAQRQRNHQIAAAAAVPAAGGAQIGGKKIGRYRFGD